METQGLLDTGLGLVSHRTLYLWEEKQRLISKVSKPSVCLRLKGSISSLLSLFIDSG